MTVQAQFVPRNYDVFGGLDVDKKSMAVSFTDHRQLKQALRLPYSAELLLSYVRKHFPEQRVAFVYEAGPTGEDQSTRCPEILRESARRPAAQLSYTPVQLSRAATSGAVARQSGQP